MNKYDLIPTSAAVIVALVWFIVSLIFSSNGERADIYLNNTLIESLDLSVERDGSVISDGNTLLSYNISGGKIDVTSADCEDKLCVHQKPISKNGENIVCLPQKIVITINSDTKSGEFDGFTN
ncbi:MAG: NusG domain II-containing protein [Lachnospiraceae bacterium]|nr:NusG domain II-containing protein [Lachnospiraceae bacterium]